MKSCQRVLWIALVVLAAFPAQAVEQVWVQEGTVIWKMDTNGHRVTKRDLGNAFGMSPVLRYDDGYEVVWAMGAGKFGVYDLREPVPEPQILIEKTPRGAQNFDLAIVGWNGSVQGAAREPQYGETMLSVIWMDGMVQLRVDQYRIGKDESASGRLQWVGDAWFQTQKSRALKGEGSAMSFPKESDTQLPMAYQNCTEMGWCGRSVPFLNEKLRLVVTEVDCAQGCYPGCHVLDPRKGVAQPPNLLKFQHEKGIPSGSCRDYFVASDGMHFATARELCMRDSGGAVTCKAAPGQVLGWIGGKVVLNP